MIKVVAGLINKDNKILIGKRLSGEPAGMWEFPGGKMEPNETPEMTLKRELKEELNIEIENIHYLTKNTHDYPTRTINIQLFYCDYKSGEIILDSHSQVQWINIDDLFKYEISPGDINLAKYIIEHKNSINY